MPPIYVGGVNMLSGLIKNNNRRLDVVLWSAIQYEKRIRVILHAKDGVESILYDGWPMGVMRDETLKLYAANKVESFRPSAFYGCDIVLSEDKIA